VHAPPPAQNQHLVVLDRRAAAIQLDQFFFFKLYD
jgi:hypothetical protein